MTPIALPESPYLLLTPGPLTTTASVKRRMMTDACTWDDDYNNVVQQVRARLVELATSAPGYTSVLMQGSGTASVESVIGSVIPEDGKLAVVANGVYGRRIAQIAQYLRIPHHLIDAGETASADLVALQRLLAEDPAITHVAVVHCETTTGMLNPIEQVGRIARAAGKVFIVDAMSSFGGIEMDIDALQIDFLISSANKCIQGVPGFGFVIARRERMAEIGGRARSLSLDLHDQWACMEDNNGKWRFTSPTHVVRAFAQALNELDEEGGIAARAARYRDNHRTLVEGMRRLGFRTLLDDARMSPIITSFYSPESPDYSFKRFYALLKARGFVIYPGKVSDADCFRIGNIGDIQPADMARLIEAIGESCYWSETVTETPAQVSA
ncbi:2-aminoethylphosphonate--pyruvate transaminase [Marinobacterium nitratireducens]|uniref:2-aminoethylphosphonate--pyruvate transaminase n=1 Tax=Marinobacterium nitratireducens TaxID=518897 RepID=A0A917Z7P5_9GAMM|nr:2-aminoethylphosphonate--pyruvate transaminase [Marinobacterium nitratireducens]GGO75400.1 2-aminoethylphosphonate--pyruvate transaminase [Marinobacterium nitratireducens]